LALSSDRLKKAKMVNTSTRQIDEIVNLFSRRLFIFSSFFSDLFSEEQGRKPDRDRQS